MKEKELTQLLEQLHSEIENTQAVDDKGRELLQHLDGDIQRLLERTEGESGRSPTNVLDQLQDTIDHLEVTHPTITAILSQFLTTLSNSGI
jgi:hypothetical protein